MGQALFDLWMISRLILRDKFQIGSHDNSEG